MDKEPVEGKPEPRFENFEEVFDGSGQAVGFTLVGNDFIFRYDSSGGWKDEKGNQYSSKGVLIKPAEDESGDEPEEDEEILDQFEQMLDDEEKGVTSKSKPKKEEKEKSFQSIDQETSALIKKYIDKIDIREELRPEIPLYFKMRSKYYERVKPQVQNFQDTNSRNEAVRKIKQTVEEKTKSIREKNKWLSDDHVFLDFSGTSLDENSYDRYWYGTVWAEADNYLQIRTAIKQSEEFAFLEEKSFYALKSKFFLKKKMRETLTNLNKELPQTETVKITVNTLPENFAASYILQLFEYTRTPLEEVYSIQLKDEQTAIVIISTKAAGNFLNLEGYCHYEKQYVWLELQESQVKLSGKKLFKISTDTPYKIHLRECADTMALEASRDEIAKAFTEEQQKSNGGFRFVVGMKSLRRVLMFRGNTINVIKVELF